MKIVLIPFSLGAMGKNNGTELGPAQLAKSIKAKSAKTVEIGCFSIERAHKAIEKTVFSCLKNKQKCLFLGGDHSIAYGTLRAFSKRHGKKNAALVLFDAHADCTYFTSAKSHEDYVRALVEEGFLLPKNILIVGLRHTWKEERSFLKRKKIKAITTRQLQHNISLAKKEISNFVSSRGAVYVSLDFDVLDSSVAFATGYPEPNGLSEKEFFLLLDAALQQNVRAIDFVEFNPLLDKNNNGLNLASGILRFVLRKT